METGDVAVAFAFAAQVAQLVDPAFLQLPKRALRTRSVASRGAYRRGSALEKRRAALALWERHVLGAGDDATTVVPFVRR